MKSAVALIFMNEDVRYIVFLWRYVSSRWRYRVIVSVLGVRFQRTRCRGLFSLLLSRLQPVDPWKLPGVVACIPTWTKSQFLGCNVSMVSRIADPIEVKEMKAMRCAANLRQRNRGLFAQWIYYCNCRSKRTILSKPPAPRFSEKFLVS